MGFWHRFRVSSIRCVDVYWRMGIQAGPPGPDWDIRACHVFVRCGYDCNCAQLDVINLGGIIRGGGVIPHAIRKECRPNFYGGGGNEVMGSG